MTQLNISMQRARLLLQQGRYADAEREFRRTLAADPNDAEAHALLAEALLGQQRVDEAAVEVTLAVRQDPELEVGHFVMARVLLQQNRFDEAEQATRRAIQLIPYPRTFGLLAAIRFELRDWRGALAAADEGLTVDPQDSTCLNLRAMALRQLGRHAEADRTLQGALENDPDDSFAHANRGWSELHQGQPREAMTHFREALRLDPSNDHARAGLVEALKARYLFYRVVLGYFLWMGRLQGSAQTAIVLGGWVGYQVLRGFARANPQHAWLVMPVIVAYIAFAWMTWLASPLMDLALRLHPVGRHALSPDQRRTSNVVGGLLLAAAATFGVSRAFPQLADLDVAALYLAIATFPGSLIFRADRGWPRVVLAAMTGVMSMIALLSALAMFGVLPKILAAMVLLITIPAVLAAVFGSQIVAAQRVRR